MSDGLRVSTALDLPLDAVTQTIAILARRGAGKTYTAKVLAEEMIGHGLPVVILDPVGVWWGLRSGADGKSEGLPVTILGGDHGDLPLEAGAGKLVANLVAGEPVAIVLDLSALPSKNQQRQFTTDFAEQLYRAKASNRAPLHLMIDEADEFAPQRVPSGDQRQLGAFETLVRRGRARGIGVTMITQRPAVLNKNVLTQIECLVVMQITSPQDRKALGEWVSGHAEAGEQARVEESLALLKQGESWWWSPAWLGDLQRVKIRKARTFDSSATPKPGERHVEASVLAPVDLDALKDAMADTVARVEANDPKVLQARVRELERELAERYDPAERVEIQTVRVEVPFIPEWLAPMIANDVHTADEIAVGLRSMAETLGQQAHRLERMSVARSGQMDDVRALRDEVGAVAGQTLTGEGAPARRSDAASTGKLARDTRKVPSAPAPQHAGTVPVPPLSEGPRQILAALIRYPGPMSKRRLAALIGVSPKKSTLRGYLADLRKAQLIGMGEPIELTPAGVTVARGIAQPLPTGPELLDHWRGQLGTDNATRRAFDAMVAEWPSTLSKAELAEAIDVDAGSSTIRGALADLRNRGLVDGMTLSPDLMEAIR